MHKYILAVLFHSEGAAQHMKRFGPVKEPAWKHLGDVPFRGKTEMHVNSIYALEDDKEESGIYFFLSSVEKWLEQANAVSLVEQYECWHVGEKFSKSMFDKAGYEVWSGPRAYRELRSEEE